MIHLYWRPILREGEWSSKPSTTHISWLESTTTNSFSSRPKHPATGRQTSSHSSLLCLIENIYHNKSTERPDCSGGRYECSYSLHCVRACTPFAFHTSLLADSSGSLDLWRRKALKSKHCWSPSSCTILRSQPRRLPPLLHSGLLRRSLLVQYSQFRTTFFRPLLS
jgi:hypothetical protein